MAYGYKVGGKGVELKIAEDMVVVRFREPSPISARLAAAAKPELGDFQNRYEVPKEKYTVLQVAPLPKAPRERLEGALSAMRADPSVERCAPVFVVGEAYAIATERLLVGFKSAGSAKKILKDKGCEIVEQVDNEFVVSIDPGADPFEVIAALDALPQVTYAEPDFVSFGSHVPQPASDMRPADPLAPDQYAIRITKAEEAWLEQTGNPDIKIAVLDEGVDTTHEDLASAVVGTYDGVDDDTFQEPKPWDSHGTACAGLAGAIHGNDTGIKGVSAGCSLMAVRIAFSESPRGRWKTRSSWIARAIDWSWQNGADVLSNSWGGGAPSTAITNAFNRAREKGRNGLGSVVVVAAGNADTLHDYPGELEDVLTVSASNEFDEPKTKTSQDGEDWWGSSFGPNVDVAAPGVHNYTTDIMGEAGHNDAPPPEGNYNPAFNGTSSATPIVAGAAALVLSANPNLSEKEVCAIIRNSADKVGGIPYQNGRNDRMGHGRLNVLRAVRAAKGDQGDQGDDTLPPPPAEIPTGKHAPVSNTDTDSEIEANVLVAHPGSEGEAESGLHKTRKGEEMVAGYVEAEGHEAAESPNTEGLRNIAEATYGPPAPEAETVHGRDNRVQIHSTADYPWRVHASLLVTARDGSRWIGTGWFIGPRTLVTAGHVVYIKNSGMPQRDGWVSRIEVMPGRNGNHLPFGAVRSEVFHSVVGWTEDGDETYDYAAITIPTSLGETVGTLGFGVYSRSDLRRVIGNLSGYPGDKPDGTQWYDRNRIASITSHKVYYDIDTAGGQSGAAVYRIDADGFRTAFGIHAYGGRWSNSATRITTPVYNNLQNWLRV